MPKKVGLQDRLYALLERLFKELDQDAIQREVIALKVEHPGADRRELATVLVRKAAVAAGSVGAGAGAIGGALGVLAMAPDIFNLVRLQSRLILSIAFLYDQKPHLRERFKEVLATLAVSTGASAGRQGARYLLQRGLEGDLAKRLARKIAGRLVSRKLPSAVPFLGGVAGAGLNFLAVRATGHAAMAYYESVLERQQKSLIAPVPPKQIASAPAKRPPARRKAPATAAKTGAKKKARAKPAAKKRAPRKTRQE